MRRAKGRGSCAARTPWLDFQVNRHGCHRFGILLEFEEGDLALTKSKVVLHLIADASLENKGDEEVAGRYFIGPAGRAAYSQSHRQFGLDAALELCVPLAPE